MSDTRDEERRGDDDQRRLVEAAMIASRKVLQEFSIHDLETHDGRQEERKDRYHANKLRHLCVTTKSWAMKTAIGVVVVAFLGAIWKGIQANIGVLPK